MKPDVTFLDGAVRRNRSSEEVAMRDLIVPELRRLYPGARIIHELPLRYSTNRIDLAAVTPSEIIAVEIKSSRDVIDRLEAQVRGFLPISAKVIVALAPKWNEELPLLREEVDHPKLGRHTRYVQQYTETQTLLRSLGDSAIETWTVDVEAGTTKVTAGGYRQQMPWLARMLDLLHVAELVEIAREHRCWSGKRPVHFELVRACVDLMTGREIVAEVCGALRSRDAFARESDPPIGERWEPPAQPTQAALALGEATRHQERKA